MLKQALERSDVRALLVGLLCCPGMAETCPAPLQAFYAALLPVAASSETPWALLNAMLPIANAVHTAMLQRRLCSGSMAVKMWRGGSGKRNEWQVWHSRNDARVCGVWI